MKVIVVGLTESILNLNKCGVPIRGKTQAILEIDSEEKKNEILVLKRSGYLDILDVNEPKETQPEVNPEVNPVDVPEDVEELPEEIEDAPQSPRLISISFSEPEIISVRPSDPEVSNTKPEDKPKKKGGRPKGSKNKNKKVEPPKPIKAVKVVKSEQQRVVEAEAETQKMGSRVVIGMGNEHIETKMRNTFEGHVEESDATKESLRAMEKIEKEEAEEKHNITNPKVDESKLDPSEQMGREAVFTQEGNQVKSPMAKSIIPEQEKINKNDPFIDKKDVPDLAFIDQDTKAKDPSEDAFIDKSDDDIDDLLKT